MTDVTHVRQPAWQPAVGVDVSKLIEFPWRSVAARRVVGALSTL
jgi:hypothetical protein